MDKKSFINGLFYSTIAASIWGCVQVIYFNSINYIPPFEIVSHRCIWSFVFLFLLIFIKKKFNDYLLIFKSKKNLMKPYPRMTKVIKPHEPTNFEKRLVNRLQGFPKKHVFSSYAQLDPG